ncbi:hypothetical protein ES703_51256 [subsurface metagenome]
MLNNFLQCPQYISSRSIQFQIDDKNTLAVIRGEELLCEKILVLNKIFQEVRVSINKLLVDLENMAPHGDF